MLGLEHLLFVLSTFAFPPVALTVLLCIILATFGKSLGLRQMYVDTLINIFEVSFYRDNLISGPSDSREMYLSMVHRTLIMQQC